MSSKTRMYIDARGEEFKLGDTKKITYKIDKINEDDIKLKIYNAIGMYTLRLEIIPDSEKLIITYYENQISPSFMEYRFDLKELDFERL